MRNKGQIIAETIDVIKIDKKIEAYFFSKAKNPDFFPALVSNGFFDPKTIERPVQTPRGERLLYWPQANYLEHISKMIGAGDIDDAAYINSVLGILRGIRDIEGNSFIGRGLFGCMTNIPAKYLSPNDIDLSFSWIGPRRPNDSLMETTVYEGFQQILSNLRDDQQDLDVFNSYVSGLFELNEEKDRNPDFLYFSNYGIKQFRGKYLTAAKLGETRPFVLENFVFLMGNLLDALLTNNDIDAGSYYWRPAIEPHEQNEYHDSAQAVLVDLIFEASCELMRNGRKPRPLAVWSSSRFVTHKRLFIALGSAFPDQIPREDVAQAIIGAGLTTEILHEAYHFLKNHFALLEVGTQDKIIEMIRRSEVDFGSNDEEQKIFSAWMKMRWIHSIKHLADQKVQALHSEIVAVIGDKEIENPDFSTYMSSGWVGPQSPWTNEDFAKASVDQILEMLSNFKNNDKFDAPTVSGLSRIFEDFILQDQAKSAAIVSYADDLPYEHISALFDGFSKAWAEKKFVPVKLLLELGLRLSKNQNFIERLDQEQSKADWIVSSVSRFITAGTKSDVNSFDPSANVLAYEILRNFAAKVSPSGGHVSTSDVYTKAINEPRGKIFEALIILTLRRARLSEAGKPEFLSAWNELKQIIEPILKQRHDSETSLFALLGAYYRQILYLDKQWLLSNFEMLVPSPEEKESLWRAFLNGFAYVSAYVREVYALLDERGYLLRFLRLDEPNEQNASRIDRLQNRIVELALVSYVLENESLEHGLLATIVRDQMPDEWRQIFAASVPILGEKKKTEHIARIKDLLSLLIQTRKNNPSQDWLSHFRGVDRLLEVLDNPAEKIVEDLIEILLADKSEYWELGFVVEFLHNYRSTHPNETARLFAKVVKESAVPPMWPEEKVGEIFEMLIQHNKVLAADLIRVYVDRGFSGELITNIHNKLNQS